METGAMTRSTTILAIRRGRTAVIAGDGQVTVNDTIIKADANKIRRLCDGKVLCGIAGATADAFALMERFEQKLDEFQGNLRKSAIELAKDWRTDKVLRNLQALMIVLDKKDMLLLTGMGDVIEPPGGIAGIGSGGDFAVSAARALAAHTKMPVKKIAVEAMKIAADICVYTNKKIVVEEL